MDDARTRVGEPALFETVISPQVAAGADRPAIAVQGRTCGYGVLELDIRRCIARLTDEGLAPGAVVLIDTPDLHMFWALAFACEALGLTACASPPGGTTEPLLRLVRPALRVTSVSEVMTPGLRTLMIDDAFVADLVARAPAATPTRDRRGEDVLFILLTSGTTGAMKGVAVTRAMLEARSRHFVELIARDPQVAPRGLGVIGPWSIGGVQAAFYVWLYGGCLCSPDVAEGWAERLRVADPDIIQLAPVHLQQLLAGMEGWRPSRECRVFVIGGTPSASLIAQAREKLTPDIWVTYGATEAGVVASAHIDELTADRAVAGRIHPWTTAEVLDDAHAPAPAGAIGVLRVRVEGMAHAYLGEPAGAAGSPFRDGWFWPGDLASIDTDRVLRIHGRTDDLLHLGGAKLLPSDLERVVEPRPGVKECAAFTAPDADGLEVPFVAVSAGEGFDVAGAAAALRAQIGRPVLLVSVDVLPRNALGKVERTRLRAAVIDGGAAPSR